jgi:hypothetical protein
MGAPSRRDRGTALEHRAEGPSGGAKKHSIQDSEVHGASGRQRAVPRRFRVRRLPNREMDHDLGQLEGWVTAIRNAETRAAGFTYVATGHGSVGTVHDTTAWSVATTLTYCPCHVCRSVGGSPPRA